MPQVLKTKLAVMSCNKKLQKLS